MSHEATNWAFRQRGLKPATKMVLLALANCHNPHRGCFPSKRHLAADCEMSERSVADHLKILAEAGLIRIEKSSQQHRGQFASNRYILGFESEFCRGQDSPSAKSAVGKIEHLPSAKFAVDRRQNLPTNPVIEPRKGNSNSAPAFSDFWSKWPNKVSKVAAEKAWKKLSAPDKREAMEAAPGWFSAWRARNPDASPIHPASYLNQKRWQDETPQTADPEKEKRRQRWRSMGR